jgi:hypothetical protein
MDASGRDFGVYVFGLALTLRNNNHTMFQGSGTGAAFQIEAIQKLTVVSQCILNSSGVNLFNLVNVFSIWELADWDLFSNFVTGSLISLTSYEAVFVHWLFQKNTGPLLNSSGTSTVSATFRDCTFDSLESDVAFPVWATVVAAQFGVLTEANLAFIPSQECWDQSRYRFVEPAVYKKAIIGAVFGMCIVIGIVFLVVETRQDRKERQEMLGERAAQETLNQAVFVDDDGGLHGAMDELQRHRRRVRRQVLTRR